MPLKKCVIISARNLARAESLFCDTVPILFSFTGVGAAWSKA